MPELLTTQEAAAYLRVNEQTLRSYVSRGLLRSQRNIRRHLFTKEMLNEFLAQQQRGR